MKVKERFEKTKQKAFNWVKDHKDEILLGTGYFAGVAAVIGSAYLAEWLVHGKNNILESEVVCEKDDNEKVLCVGIDIWKQNRFGKRDKDPYLRGRWEPDAARRIGQNFINAADGHTEEFILCE